MWGGVLAALAVLSGGPANMPPRHLEGVYSNVLAPQFYLLAYGIPLSDPDKSKSAREYREPKSVIGNWINKRSIPDSFISFTLCMVLFVFGCVFQAFLLRRDRDRDV
jgi:hypothetical protein